MASLPPLVKFQAENATGIVPGAKLYTYAAGTLTPLATYTNQGGLSSNANPVVCDTNGQADVWLGAAAYRLILKTSADVTIWDVDNVTGSAALSASNGTTLVGWLRAATSSVATTLYKYLNWQDVNVFEFMTVAQIADVQARTLLVDVGAACRAAVAAAIAQNKTRVYFPAGSYLIGSTAGSDSFGNGILLPFTTVNPDPTTGLTLCGAGDSTVLCAGTNTMILLRVSRNNVTLRDFHMSANGKTGCWGLGIVPEDITQTTTQVSQQNIHTDGVGQEGFTEGLVIQPGPQVSGSDSGCFYMSFKGGYHNLNTRHVYVKKNVDWASFPNRATRIKFDSFNCMRGNTGFQFEVGSEIVLISCHEELIATGTTPNTTPTARVLSSSTSNITFIGGYSEACSASVSAAALFYSSGYIPASGATADWRTYACTFGDGIDDSSTWTPVLVSSGGGAQGTATSTGKVSKTGKMIHFTCQVSAAKGTLAAGTLSVTGLPFIADSTWNGAGFQGMPMQWSGITFTTNVFSMVGTITSATLTPRKQHSAGAGPATLTLAECADPVIFSIHGSYKAV